MSVLPNNRFKKLIDESASCSKPECTHNNEIQTHLYLEQLLLLDEEVQDDVIDKISRLSYCDSASVNAIFMEYKTDNL